MATVPAIRGVGTSPVEIRRAFEQLRALANSAFEDIDGEYLAIDGSNANQDIDIGAYTLIAQKLTDGTFEVVGGVVTGASGNISMWTNDAGYLTTESDTLDAVCDRGDTTDQLITTTGGLTVGADASPVPLTWYGYNSGDKVEFQTGQWDPMVKISQGSGNHGLLRLQSAAADTYCSFDSYGRLHLVEGGDKKLEFDIWNFEMWNGWPLRLHQGGVGSMITGRWDGTRGQMGVGGNNENPHQLRIYKYNRWESAGLPSCIKLSGDDTLGADLAGIWITSLDAGSGTEWGIVDDTSSGWKLQNDSAKLFLGAAPNASITYDGSDLVIDPAEVGTGYLKVLGHIETAQQFRGTDIDANYLHATEPGGYWRITTDGTTASDVTLETTYDHNVKIPNGGLYLGDDGDTPDASIEYDGSDLQVNSAEVGTGSAVFNGGAKVDNAGDVIFQSYTDATRPAAGTAGKTIFNTDDGQLNVDNGTNWTLPDGTVT